MGCFYVFIRSRLKALLQSASLSQSLIASIIVVVCLDVDASILLMFVEIHRNFSRDHKPVSQFDKH